MKIILAVAGNGYCGCESEDAFFFENDASHYEMEEEIMYWARENSESFAHVHFGWDEEYSEEEYAEYLEEYTDVDWWEATYEEYLEWCDNWGYTPKSKEEIER